MQSANQKPGKLDMLSQHASETSHRSGKLDMLSQLTQCRCTLPACTARSKLYKRGCKGPEQWTSHRQAVDKMWDTEEPRTRDLHKRRRASRASSYNTLGG